MTDRLYYKGKITISRFVDLAKGCEPDNVEQAAMEPFAESRRRTCEYFPSLCHDQSK